LLGVAGLEPLLARRGGGSAGGALHPQEGDHEQPSRGGKRVCRPRRQERCCQLAEISAAYPVLYIQDQELTVVIMNFVTALSKADEKRDPLVTLRLNLSSSWSKRAVLRNRNRNFLP
jgi:hypothetical protein